jgi:membrane dipeptidase
MVQRLLFDGHLDLAWNALSLNRDLTEPIEQIRQRERGLADVQSRGNAMVSLPAMRDGRVGFCLPTILARARREVMATLRGDMDYGTQELADCTGWAQRRYYELLERQGHLRIIGDAAVLSELYALWQDTLARGSGLPIGCILSMEGADPILSPDDLCEWWDAGLRVLSLVHYGNGPYAAGTACTGPVTKRGRELLGVMRELGVILDVTHLSDEAFEDAMDFFDGPVIATHSNCRAIAPDQRQLSDQQIRVLVDREAVIGVVMDIWMLRDWPKDTFTAHGFMSSSTNPNSDSTRRLVSLADLARHIDHICQIAGDCRHVAIGSDLDGGFGTEQAPGDVETISDLQQLASHLSLMGYSSRDIEGIFSDNWFGFFLAHLPGSVPLTEPLNKREDV